MFTPGQNDSALSVSDNPRTFQTTFGPLHFHAAESPTHYAKFVHFLDVDGAVLKTSIRINICSSMIIPKKNCAPVSIAYRAAPILISGRRRDIATIVVVQLGWLHPLLETIRVELLAKNIALKGAKYY